ncbi:transcriptional regulator [Halarcobacter mediterraneus]|uniref:Transcriptional regulator n=2 Tax=Halarcobacter mediterraneus TaxID=2023153 RepID=A0A4Q1AV30_9BACT|nr:transcriptional regulator [Halarcobacter mediterraneus]
MKITPNNKKTFKIILKHLNILYLEDEKNIRKNITETLNLIAFKVFDVESINDAIKVLEKERINIIISDINLKEENGLSFIKSLREKYIDIPIILLTAYTDKNYLLEATKLKLVDYLIKPTDFNTLNNSLNKAAEEIYLNGKFIINFSNNISYDVLHKTLFLENEKKELELTAKEIELLDLLIENHNKVLEYEIIKDIIWKDSIDITDSALKNLVNKLRKKIGKDTIKNISGVGFKINF